MIKKKFEKSKRSQSAIEFIILVGFVLFLFTIFFLAIQGDMSEELKEREELAVKEAAISIQDEINLAYQSSEGYYRQFKVPENLNGKDYEVDLVDDMVYVRTSDGKNAISLPIKNVTTTVGIKKGINIIKKQEGVVVLN